jgi:hypothetical protein
MTSVADGTVVMGVIDDGIAFAHDRFRNGLSTRVEYWWLQDGIYRAGPSGLLYGRELGKADIDDLIQKCTSAGIVDEDELYQRAGLNDFRFDLHKSAAWRLSHGTHVMDLACGHDPNDNRMDRPIVCVQLPARVTADTSGAQLCFYATEAINYILRRADQIAQQRKAKILPVVINMSYGLIGGPHDGTMRFERFMDASIAQRRARGSTLDIVLPAGNSHLARCHAQVNFSPPSSIAELPWRILPDDRTASYLDVWLPPLTGSGSGRLELTVTPPNGAESPPFDEGSTSLLQLRDANNRVYCELQYHLFGAPTARGRIRVSVQPTTVLDSSFAIAPAGVWTIRLKNKSLAPSERVHAWIQRDETLYGHPIRGRQSYFHDASYQRYDHPGRDVEVDNTASLVRRASLLNGIGTGHETVVIGGFVRSTRRMAKYSAAGPSTQSQSTTRPARRGPDAVTISDDAIEHDGVLGAASRSGAAIALNGTSVAAPQIARWLACERAKGVMTRGRDLVAARAANDEQAASDPQNRPTPERGGAGRINLAPVRPLSRFLT